MRIVSTQIFLLPIRTRVPLKFGAETLTEVTCARVRVEVVNEIGERATGWGETPLSVQWVWPSTLPYARRFGRLIEFIAEIGRQYLQTKLSGHPLEIGTDFQNEFLPSMLEEFNRGGAPAESVPWLAALLCFSPFDLAAHDAYGQLIGRPTFSTCGSEHLTRDLASLIEDEQCFRGKYPADFLVCPRRERLVAWHLVGGLDPLEPSEILDAPADDYPLLLRDWIADDGLKCLKIKLRGNDARWDFDRLLRVGEIGLAGGALWFSADFNCTVRDAEYVNQILDRLAREQPQIDRALLYVEQPFGYDLEAERIDVRSVVKRKPLFLDESAHDWRHVRLGRELGWNGVALKTCKTLSGALLSACWATAHGMSLMVQDLTNPMLAQISHVGLAANLNTIMGVETNAMQFYPDASLAEAAVHPGLFRRRNGQIDLSSVSGPGLGYRLGEIQRTLPKPFASFGD